MFLSVEEIRTLTGKRRPSAQIRWLHDHGYKIDVNGLGQPVLSIREYHRRKSGAAYERQQEPHWEHLDGQTT